MIRFCVRLRFLLSNLFVLAAIAIALPATAEQAGQLTESALTSWLTEYGAAWESRDPDKAAELFAEDSSYQVTPYEDAHIGRSGVHEYWAGVTESQRDVDFDFQLLAVSGNSGIAHWTAEFDVDPPGLHIKLDGIFVLDFDESGKVERLREWWHSEAAEIESGD